MDKFSEEKIDQHSDELEVESEEKQRGKKIEVDEDRLPLTRDGDSRTYPPGRRKRAGA